MTDSTQPPPGEPHAEALAEQLADVQVMDGPLRGSVWTYEAALADEFAGAWIRLGFGGPPDYSETKAVFADLLERKVIE